MRNFYFVCPAVGSQNFQHLGGGGGGVPKGASFGGGPSQTAAPKSKIGRKMAVLEAGPAKRLSVGPKKPFRLGPKSRNHIGEGQPFESP